MTAVVSHLSDRAIQVVVGIDTHQDQHVAVAVDQLGISLSKYHAAATTCGYVELEQWARSLGQVRAFGIEGTGSYGAGLTRFLTNLGYVVIEVNRPDRSIRHRKGKTDTTDAEMAARAVLAGVANTTPKSGEGDVEMIRILKTAKDSAIKARTQAINQMKSLVITAPAEVREKLDGLNTNALATRCRNFRPGRLDSPTAAAKYTLRSLANRYRQLTREIQDLKVELEQLVRTAAPTLVQSFGVGPDTAAALLVAAGSNPDRLNRGGDRQANAALYRIVVVRLRHGLRTRAYMCRRTGEGMSKSEVIRCLKRYVAREVFTIIQKSAAAVSIAA